MFYISDISTDPCFNLAEEEFLLKSMDQDIFRLWRNSPSIIVGRYQNTIAEIDTEFTSKHNIPVVRRLTGGGAVFHDLGNLNFTFIQTTPRQSARESLDTSDMFHRFTSPIVEALRIIGVNACLQGRNDLAIDGMKFSGNAICKYKNRVLMHGTLMYDVSKTDLSKALKPRPEKFIGKAVKSNVKRVTNIKEHLPDKNADIIWFKDFIGSYVCSHLKDITPYSFTKEQLRQIENLKASRYATDEWNYGKSPSYTFSNTRRFPSGIVELYLNIKDGKIAGADIRGDYFFTRPTEEFAKKLIGTPHSREDIKKKIGTLELGAYFAGIDSEDFVSLFF
ncbi:MAG: lipoate--protein ligase [Bacteroidales bacterium]|nr:lipoate--protein ligase [Bacteroidales bacterium]